ncbi:MAG TPA: hypothetical protein O0X27_04825 [Methanocorpusculum sp.]|nr:hypothetical protein [Methanocorpusculum sp.]
MNFESDGVMHISRELIPMMFKYKPMQRMMFEKFLAEGKIVAVDA